MQVNEAVTKKYKSLGENIRGEIIDECVETIFKRNGKAYSRSWHVTALNGFNKALTLKMHQKLTFIVERIYARENFSMPVSRVSVNQMSITDLVGVVK